MEISKENKELINKYLKFREAAAVKHKTLKSDSYCLTKLAGYFDDRNIRDLNKEELQEFFIDNRNFAGYNLLGTKLKIFYRWIDDNNGVEIGKKETPKRMKWFTYKKPESKDSHKLKEQLITETEYKKILESCKRDRYGMWEGIWETFWLSGARLGEVASMKINDAKFSGKNCIIYVPESKTKTREIPLPEYPYRLERWVNNHPERNNPMVRFGYHYPQETLGIKS